MNAGAPCDGRASAAPDHKPQLLFFYAPTSGPCRRVDAFLSQVLQRRRNHETFRLLRIPAQENETLAARLRISEVPTILVVEGNRIRARIVAPKGRRELDEALSGWLR